MKFSPAYLCALALLAFSCARGATPHSLDIYFIDVEGGQSTLLVTPTGQSFLIDTGWAGNGAQDALPGDPVKARDANRIVAAAKDAGIRQIDYLMITHFHPDHDGGIVELSQLMPIRHFIDHGTLPQGAPMDGQMTGAYDHYMAIRNKAPHIVPKPGDKLPIKGIDVQIVASDKSVLTAPLPGAGAANEECGQSGIPAGDPYENPRSTGVKVTFGKFRFLDMGDLSGEPLFNLACPNSLIGPVDVYLVSHHGGPDNANPAIFAAFKPRVAIMNNGLKKGGGRATYQTLHHVAGLEDVWQVHWSEAAGDQNFPTDHIANPDESTSNWIKLTANEDGSFRVTNGRTGQVKSYPAPAPSPPPSADLRLYILDCGTIAAMDASMYNFKPGEVNHEVSFVSPCYLVVHPKGTLMWETGQIPDKDIPDDGTEVVQQGILKARHRLSSQLAALGYQPKDITYVAMSHYHVDHTANANMFAGSTWIVQQAEYDSMFGDAQVDIRVPDTYKDLKTARRITLNNGDRDIFGDGRVIIKSAPGHTPGHQMLFLKLAKFGPLLLSGDLYHLPEERTLDRVPTFDFDAAMTRASRKKAEEFIKQTGSTLWIQHDPPTNAPLKKAPQYYN